MSEEMVVRLCAPTLAGIKTGSLFPCPFESRETLLMEIRQFNQVLVPKGLCLLPLRFTEGKRAAVSVPPSAICSGICRTGWQQSASGSTQAISAAAAARCSAPDELMSGCARRRIPA